VLQREEHRTSTRVQKRKGRGIDFDRKLPESRPVERKRRMKIIYGGGEFPKKKKSTLVIGTRKVLLTEEGGKRGTANPRKGGKRHLLLRVSIRRMGSMKITCAEMGITRPARGGGCDPKKRDILNGSLEESSSVR